MPSLAVKQRLAGDVAGWQADGLIDDATRQLLRARYDAPGFGLATAVRYLGIAGALLAAFGLLGLVAALSGSQAVGAALLAGSSAFLLWAGARLGRDPRARFVHSSKVVLTLGVLAWAAAAGVGASALGASSGGVIAALGGIGLPLAFAVAYRERNGFLLMVALLGAFHWIGSWSAMAGQGAYVVDIEDPRVMALAALAVFAFGAWHEQRGRPARFGVVYQATALVYLNLSLVILSAWGRDPKPYIAVLTVAALLQIGLAARLKSPLVMGFGVTTLAIDLFTRYYERLWDRCARGLFFVAGGALLMGFGALAERALRRWQAR